ncbi:LytR/AlgR family response regulator transcription factor [Flavimarina sp. Hel_I_48]|uniref:LytR/AlgR family response regulator transcription factor n=1 Tax=Flavimarina sp. Hel_I_48 TaxID=1392488 RepID=UPI0004DFBF61|nr:response regulator transcription factor [Flavimarina sp. Hel_I_48]
MSLKCIIIDDEPLAVNVIKNFLGKIKDLELVKTFNNAVDSLEFLQTHTVDLLFLDINMPMIDGFSFLQSLPYKPLVIITTAHEEYAVQSYELEVLDYLLKPIPFPRFLRAVNKALYSKSTMPALPEKTAETDYLFVKIDKKRMNKIYLNEILIVESLKDYIKIVTFTSKYIVHQTLSSFTDSLPAERFLRIHRSYTISKNKVDAIEGNCVEIAGLKYTIGRSYINEVKESLLQ